MAANQATIGVPDNNSTRVDVKLVDISNISLINTNLGTQVVMPGLTEVTPGSMENIVPGVSLRIDLVGSGVDEIIVVQSVTANTFTAHFANPHNADAAVTMEVARQKMVIGDNQNFDAVATVGQGPASPDDTGLTVRVIPGTMSLSGGSGSTASTPLYVMQTQPGSATFVGPILTTSPVSSTGQATLVAPIITEGKTGFLRKVAVSSSVPFKWQLNLVPNNFGQPYPVEVAFTTSNDLNYTFKFEDYEVFIENADGLQAGFEILATNMSPYDSADAYVSFYWREM